MAVQAQPMIRNGVDLTRLVATVEAIKATPELAKFTFRAQNTWETGGRSRTRIQGFYGAGQEDASREKPFELVGDEPPVLLGTDQAPNAVEAVLHALASCIAVGFIYNAAARGIEVTELTSSVEGDLDLHAFLGLSDVVRPGFQKIRFRYHVKSDASREKIEELCEYVQRTSPVLDIIRNAVPVSVELA